MSGTREMCGYRRDAAEFGLVLEELDPLSPLVDGEEE